MIAFDRAGGRCGDRVAARRREVLEPGLDRPLGQPPETCRRRNLDTRNQRIRRRARVALGRSRAVLDQATLDQVTLDQVTHG